MSKHPTMREVAELAGVSLMTVSRVVNGQPGVQPETAARVARAIRRLGYQRNDAARQLRRGGKPTQTIGLLVDDLANPFFAAVARAVEDAARERNCVVLVGSSNFSLRREREVVSAFCARQVDGLIVAPVVGSHRFLRDQMIRGTKVVCIDRPADGMDVDTVLVDNRRAAHDAVRHLLERGHRRIGYLGDREDIWTIQERYTGFRAAFADLGLEPDPALLVHGLLDRESAALATVSLMRAPTPPTALFASKNLITMGAIDALNGAGAVALVGFDEFALADKLVPPVTVVAQDPHAIGATAAQLLFSRVGGDTSPTREIILRTRLVARGSGEITATTVPA
ncbi:MAG TPA: LacI family DNA-binding transcriptional regulator [Streptosporangiaceae bacterium]|jgi:LacI family transcriptional regulator|nr:LacI family DNA-binding transcriptional regulator [Streptosporangiaceae bacterium]